MRPAEIKDLVVGLMVVVMIAMATGQYGKLKQFSRKQAASALKGWKTHPFFPAGYDGAKGRVVGR